MIDIETTSLSGIESGRHFPSLLTLEKISKSLNVEIKALFEFKHLLTVSDMKTKILNNIDKINDEKIKFIYKFFEDFKD